MVSRITRTFFSIATVVSVLLATNHCAVEAMFSSQTESHHLHADVDGGHHASQHENHSHHSDENSHHKGNSDSCCTTFLTAAFPNSPLTIASQNFEAGQTFGLIVTNLFSFDSPRNSTETISDRSGEDPPDKKLEHLLTSAPSIAPPLA